MQIAISGAGIAGPTLAFWLARNGHRPTLIERAPELRTTGYVIDFWGLGYTIAERMGVLPAVRDLGYQVREVRFVNRTGRKAGGFDTALFQRLTGGRFTSLPRSELSGVIFDAMGDEVETIFGNSVAAVTDTGDGLEVGFEHGPSRRFDLLVGADGLHSAVRRLVFGPDGPIETDLGYRIAAFEADGYRPRDELAYVSFAEPGRQAARFALRGDRTLFLFVFHSSLADDAGSTDPRAVLRHVFGGKGWECDRILQLLDQAGELYFDKVSQIRMPSWSKGRVALIGDAAAAVSLLAGEGTGLGMTEAYVLAGELKRAGDDYRAAFAAYEQRLREFIAGKQQSAAAFAPAFAPRTALGIWFRNQVTRLLGIPLLAERFIGRDLRDRIEIPDYEQPGAHL